jgi:hypothetical protein
MVVEETHIWLFPDMTLLSTILQHIGVTPLVPRLSVTPPPLLARDRGLSAASATRPTAAIVETIGVPAHVADVVQEEMLG